ncbi:MAG: NUDIX domain-containing protein [bacterium]
MAESTTPHVVGKALAYITRGTEVLVLRDIAGALKGFAQVPGGTMKAGESPEDAVLREAEEETGLRGLEIVAKLGYLEMPCPIHEHELQQRHYFHLICVGEELEDSWDYMEDDPSDGGAPMPIQLRFETLDGTDLGLWASYGHFLPALYSTLTGTP